MTTSDRGHTEGTEGHAGPSGQGSNLFLRLRKGLYLLLAIGSIGGALLAVIGLSITLTLLVAGIAKGDLSAAALGLLMTLACVVGATGPLWILLAVIALPGPPPKQRRFLSLMLAIACLAAGTVGFGMLMLGVRDGDYTGFETPVILFLLPMLAGLALLAELWLPVWRARRRGE